ncbi:DEAD/DEAH box helicase [Idiomarina loihiensis]|uniref:DEAD/DEAH box helicase n=1 Tax=Idiomarina loihiensis TaxID=135577 RepID=UPI001E35C4B4|nr:DEAD/DEAH box helicase [Idiomarina loihiensis]
MEINSKTPLDVIEDILVSTYEKLDSKHDSDLNQCLSNICHIADLNIKGAMVQQLLHDCITKSRVFLYSQMIEDINPSYRPENSIFDSVAKEYYTSEKTETVFTKQQLEILKTFRIRKRLVVSAPTSFGKTRVVQEIITHNSDYRVIGIVMPTVSLLSEQIVGLKFLEEEYVISKSSRVKIEEDKKYILVLTPERMANFLDENPSVKFDLFVMDEIYKADHKLKDSRFNIFSNVLYRVAKTKSDMYLIGPYISKFSENFCRKFGFEFLRFNSEIVQKTYYKFDSTMDSGSYFIDDYDVRIIKDKYKNLYRLIKKIDGKFLIYRYQKRYVEDTAKKLALDLEPVDFDRDLVNYLGEYTDKNWCLIECLKKGVGFHHGSMPRHIQDLVVENFNSREKGALYYLFCTTSLTEGVNSSAKNVVLFDNKIGDGTRNLSLLDRKNIEGRAGRFLRHFLGRVFYFEKTDTSNDDTTVEIDYLDEDNVNPETLLQVDKDDLNDKLSQQRELVELLLLNHNVDVELIKSNRFINIESQIDLIKHLRNNFESLDVFFSEKIPKKEKLNEILTLTVSILFSDNDLGEFSNEFGRKILVDITKYYIYKRPNFRELLYSKQAIYLRDSINPRIRLVFNLLSKYMEFAWPKYLIAFENIYNYVADERSKENLDLSYVISILEYGFTDTHQILLKESGLPTEIIKKISHLFSDCESYEDIIRVRKSDQVKSYIAMNLSNIEESIFNRCL